MRAGTWQESHFKLAHPQRCCGPAVLYVVTIPLWILLVLPGWIAWIGDFDLVPVPRDPGLDEP